jgi:hypothetical protein
MPDEPHRQELDAEGRVLPDREMLSLLSTDPSKSLLGLGATPDTTASPTPASGASAAPAPGGATGLPALPVDGGTGAVSDEPRNDVISQSDSSSATS